MKDAWPVTAKASGGRHYRGDYIDQNFDTYSVEYTFADGTKLFLEGRNIDGCHQEFASYAHGTKGSAVISSNSATRPARCRIYKGQNFDSADDIVWACPQPEPNPYQVEWDDLIDAIRKDKLYNEVKRGAEASLVTSMGRMAAHTGQIITFDEMLNCEHEFAPDVDKLTMDSPAPLRGRPGRQVPRAAAGQAASRKQVVRIHRLADRSPIQPAVINFHPRASTERLPHPGVTGSVGLDGPVAPAVCVGSAGVSPGYLRWRVVSLNGCVRRVVSVRRSLGGTGQFQALIRLAFPADSRKQDISVEGRHRPHGRSSCSKSSINASRLSSAIWSQSSPRSAHTLRSRASGIPHPSVVLPSPRGDYRHNTAR